MEAFTSGKVSVLAKRSYLADNPHMADQFEKIRSGYRMFAWESQIRMARAYGRGTASGMGKPAHPFDA